MLFNLLRFADGTSVNFLLSSQLIIRPSVPQNLDPENQPKRIAEEVRRELKADWVGLISAPDLVPLGESSAHHRLSEADRGVIELVIKSAQPTLTVTGPRRLPQARTNARWTNSLAVPITHDAHPVGVVYATRNSTEPFTDEDLHWLTAHASTAGPLFVARNRSPQRD